MTALSGPTCQSCGATAQMFATTFAAPDLIRRLTDALDDLQWIDSPQSGRDAACSQCASTGGRAGGDWEQPKHADGCAIAALLNEAREFVAAAKTFMEKPG